MEERKTNFGLKDSKLEDIHREEETEKERNVQKSEYENDRGILTVSPNKNLNIISPLQPPTLRETGVQQKKKKDAATKAY